MATSIDTTEYERYLKSGNDVPVTQVTLPANELRALLDRVYELEAELDSIKSDYE